MDVQITDAAALSRVPPTALRAYLQSRDWVQADTWRGRIQVWSKEHNGQPSEVLAPLRELSGSYATRMYEAVALLAELEERSQLDVYRDLLGARADVVTIRPLNGASARMWSLADSAELLDHSQDLMTAAAHAVERPNQLVHRGRISASVAEYARGVQALPGYEDGQGLTLHSLVPAGYGEQGYMDDEVKPPFPRQVTLALNKGLAGARAVADALIGGADAAAAFEKADARGVSANSCEAIAALAERGGVQIEQRWAAARPSSAPDGVFAFTKSSGEALADGADWLRRSIPFVDAHITGEVVRLSRDPKADFTGECAIVYELDGRPVTLQVHLSPNHREEVFRAFDESLEVSVYGDIHRVGNKHILKNPRDFSVR